MAKVTTFLWFDDQAEEAARFYTSLFKSAEIGDVMRYPEGGPRPAGSAMSVTFTIDGQEFIALNGGPHFKFTEAISLFVKCDDQAELDELWERLSEGGEKSRCGWLKDKYGLSWQIVPVALRELLQDPDREKSRRVMQALMQMRKLDIAALQQAHRGG